jgi:hypothetical protein
MFQGWTEVSQEQAFFLLTQLHQLFLDHTKWIDWPQAIDATGQEVDPHSPNAVAWCLMGASAKIAVQHFGSPLGDFVDCATREFLVEVYDDRLIGKLLSYDDELAIISLALDYLTPKETV